MKTNKAKPEEQRVTTLRKKALGSFLKIDISKIKTRDLKTFSVNRDRYSVFYNDEAEKAHTCQLGLWFSLEWSQEEAVAGRVSDEARKEAKELWFKDMKDQKRAAELATDGCEHEVNVESDGESHTFYIFKIY